MENTEVTDNQTKTNSPEQEESQIDITNKKNDNKKLNEVLIINTIYYVVVFIVLGLPIWFFTTSTYRASLPFDSIEKLSESINRIDFKVKLELIHFNKALSEAELHQMKINLLHDLNNNLKKYSLTLNFDIKTRLANKEDYDLALKSDSIEKFDSLWIDNDINILRLIVLDETLAQKFAFKEPNEFLFLNYLYLIEKDTKNFENLAGFIKNQYLHMEKLNEEYRLKLVSERQIPSKKDIKVVNFDSEYEITFSLINEIPEKYSNWNIDECIGKYFLKITDQLSKFINFSIKAQTLLYSDFGSYSLSHFKAEKDSFYYLKQTDLSIMTNFIESRLGSRISDSSALEFVTYISAKEPMYIASNPQNPQESQSVSFMVPRWGGIYVYNPKDENPSETSIRVDNPMKTFLTQFINLMGIELHQNKRVVSRSKIYSSEIYAYLLEKTLENQLNSINTLRSLSLLLTRINSMVIEDDIAEQVRISVESIEKSLVLIQFGKLKEAFSFSKTAFISSERAFFDKSLLEKLYFPEDQRFAIYIPLFIPVGIPLVLSLKSVINWFKQRKQKVD